MTRALKVLAVMWAVSPLLALGLESEAVKPVDPHVEYWMRTVTNHPFSLIRKNAARVLGTLGDRGVVPSLIEALKDKHQGVRGEAARSLGKLGDERALTPLYKTMEADADAQVRRNSRFALENIRAFQEYKKKQLEKARAEMEKEE